MVNILKCEKSEVFRGEMMQENFQRSKGGKGKKDSLASILYARFPSFKTVS